MDAEQRMRLEERRADTMAACEKSRTASGDGFWRSVAVRITAGSVAAVSIVAVSVVAVSISGGAPMDSDRFRSASAGAGVGRDLYRAGRFFQSRRAGGGERDRVGGVAASGSVPA